MTKKTNDAFAISGLIIGIAGLLCTIGTAPPTWLALKLHMSGDVVLIASIVLLISCLGLFLWRITESIRVITPRKPGLQSANKADLKELYALYFKHFGRETPMLAQMRRWHQRNPRIFQIIVALDPETRARRVVASFKAVPLKDDAIPLLELEQLTGSTLPEEYIAASGKKASAWYIGDVVSTSDSSARAVVKALVTYLDKNMSPGISIYARPLTEKGFRYLQEHHFEAVNGQELKLGAVCRLMGDEVAEEMGRLRSAMSYRASQQAGRKKVARAAT